MSVTAAGEVVRKTNAEEGTVPVSAESLPQAESSLLVPGPSFLVAEVFVVVAAVVDVVVAAAARRERLLYRFP